MGRVQRLLRESRRPMHEVCQRRHGIRPRRNRLQQVKMRVQIYLKYVYIRLNCCSDRGEHGVHGFGAGRPVGDVRHRNMQKQTGN